MPLEEYRAKRRFDRTPEPGAAEAETAADAELSFVVQKHDASRLHYDFRLELDGVLESWAVPKGPSLAPRDRRLAVRVEAHPLAYADFEGVIPEGQYGGGPVIVWDRGRWLPEGGVEGAREGLEAGKLHFELEGEKLHGGWILVRMGGGKGKDGDDWLLFKRDDEAARPGAGASLVEERAESVISGRTVEEVAAAPERVWRSNREERPARRPSLDPSRVSKARRAVPPEDLEPQLATLAAEVPRGDRWLHEIKLDGYRAFCRIEGRPEAGGAERRLRFLTRRGKDWTRKLGPLVAEAARLPVESAVLDGEVVALLEDGRSDYGALQDVLARGAAERLHYQAFDLLHLDGWDLTRAPLEERKALLRELLEDAAEGGRVGGGGGRIRYADHVEGRGEDFLRQACRFALEGVISKRRDRPYRPGRGKDWIKTKCLERQEFVVGGFTEPSGSRSGLGALLLGVHDEGGRLRYSGRVGTGFTGAELRQLRRSLEPLERPEPAFADPPRGAQARGVHWVEPELVAEVEFTEWTRDGVLRHPSFRGLREDKDPADVVRERPVNVEDGDTLKRPSSVSAGAGGANRQKRPTSASAGAGGGEERTMTKARAKGGPITVEGVRLTSPDKLLYPETGVTKRELAEYYRKVADWILPHLRGRPLTLVRCPEGWEGECFYQKHVDRHFPEAVGRVAIEEGEGGTETYAVADGLPSLVALVQMGVLELHAWGSRHDRLERPDRLTFDLDPGPGVPWIRVVEAAFVVREALDELGLASFVKTTGGKGLHVVVPLERTAGWDEAKAFSRALVERVARREPRRYTTNASKAERGGKIYLDYLRNSRGATAVAPYSPRARSGAPVSTPVRWDELSPALKSDRYTVKSIPRRLAALSEDPWAALAKTRQRITVKMTRDLAR